MDLNSLENIFKEKAWIINPIYKLLVLIVYVGGPLAALFVLMFTYKSPNTTIFIAVIILVTHGHWLQIWSIDLLYSQLFLDLFQVRQIWYVAADCCLCNRANHIAITDGCRQIINAE